MGSVKAAEGPMLQCRSILVSFPCCKAFRMIGNPLNLLADAPLSGLGRRCLDLVLLVIH